MKPLYTSVTMKKIDRFLGQIFSDDSEKNSVTSVYKGIL